MSARMKTMTAAVTAALAAALMSATAPAADPLPPAKPSQEAMDQAAVNRAILYAQTHLRASVQIFRNDCKIGQGLLDPVSDQVPTEIFSSTKSVVSVLTGIAYDQHK